MHLRLVLLTTLAIVALWLPVCTAQEMDENQDASEEEMDVSHDEEDGEPVEGDGEHLDEDGDFLDAMAGEEDGALTDDDAEAMEGEADEVFDNDEPEDEHATKMDFVHSHDNGMNCVSMVHEATAEHGMLAEYPIPAENRAKIVASLIQGAVTLYGKSSETFESALTQMLDEKNDEENRAPDPMHGALHVCDLLLRHHEPEDELAKKMNFVHSNEKGMECLSMVHEAEAEDGMFEEFPIPAEKRATIVASLKKGAETLYGKSSETFESALTQMLDEENREPDPMQGALDVCDLVLRHHDADL